MGGSREGEFLDDVLAAIEDDCLRGLYLYWEEKRAGRRFPARRDIDPLDLAFILGYLVLLDVTHDPLRFRFRLHGTMIVDQVRCDMTGKYLEEYPQSDYRPFLEKVWGDTVRRRAPTHGFYDQTIDNRTRRFESLRLPLSSDGTIIDMLLVAARYRQEEP
jgi:hypothetical protein